MKTISVNVNVLSRNENIAKKNQDLLKLIAETLLEYETLTKEQIDYLVKHGKMPEEDEGNLEALCLTIKVSTYGQMDMIKL